MARDSFLFGQIQEWMANRIARFNVDTALTVAAHRSDSESRDDFRRTKDTVGGFGWSCRRDDRRVFLPTHPNDADGCNDRDRKVHAQHTAEFAAHKYSRDCRSE